MKIIELLLEYDRTITQQRFGPQIINLARQRYGNIISDQELIDKILTAIENTDPTPNKEYTQWLTKMYLNDNVNIDVFNRHDTITAHWIGKRRGIVKPEHRDVNQFKTYQAFEDTILDNYDPYKILDKKLINKGTATTVYQDNQVRIVVPQDKAAACYYGQGTDWCTARTRSENRFSGYNKQGPLFILLPKQREYPKEKYQIHWITQEFHNDADEEVDWNILKNKFPGALEFFRKEYSHLVDNIIVLWQDKTLINSINWIIYYLTHDILTSNDPGNVRFKNYVVDIINPNNPTRLKKIRQYINDHYYTDRENPITFDDLMAGFIYEELNNSDILTQQKNYPMLAKLLFDKMKMRSEQNYDDGYM